MVCDFFYRWAHNPGSPLTLIPPLSSSPSCIISTDSLNKQSGLCKVGTGRDGTVLGKLYAQNLCMVVHGDGFITPWFATDEKEVLLLRSAVLGVDVLLVVDMETLTFTGQRIYLGRDTSSSTPSTPIPFSTSWHLEFCNMDSEDRFRLKWHPLPQLYTDRARAFFTSNFKLDDVIPLEDNLSLRVTRNGISLRLHKQGDMSHYPVRIIHAETLMPIFVECNSNLLHAMRCVSESSPFTDTASLEPDSKEEDSENKDSSKQEQEDRRGSETIKNEGEERVSVFVDRFDLRGMSFSSEKQQLEAANVLEIRAGNPPPSHKRLVLPLVSTSPASLDQDLRAAGSPPVVEQVEQIEEDEQSLPSESVSEIEDDNADANEDESAKEPNAESNIPLGEEENLVNEEQQLAEAIEDAEAADGPDPNAEAEREASLSAASGPPVDRVLLQTLCDFGFPEVRSVHALIATENRNIDVAVNWLLENSENADLDIPWQPAAASSSDAVQEPPPAVVEASNVDDPVVEAGASQEGDRNVVADDDVAMQAQQVSETINDSASIKEVGPAAAPTPAPYPYTYSDIMFDLPSVAIATCTSSDNVPYVDLIAMRTLANLPKQDEPAFSDSSSRRAHTRLPVGDDGSERVLCEGCLSTTVLSPDDVEVKMYQCDCTPNSGVFLCKRCYLFGTWQSSMHLEKHNCNHTMDPYKPKRKERPSVSCSGGSNSTEVKDAEKSVGTTGSTWTKSQIKRLLWYMNGNSSQFIAVDIISDAKYVKSLTGTSTPVPERFFCGFDKETLSVVGATMVHCSSNGFCFDAKNNVCWGICPGSGSLDRWSGLSSDPFAYRAFEGQDDVTPLEMAAAILQQVEVSEYGYHGSQDAAPALRKMLTDFDSVKTISDLCMSDQIRSWVSAPSDAKICTDRVDSVVSLLKQVYQQFSSISRLVEAAITYRGGNLSLEQVVFATRSHLTYINDTLCSVLTGKAPIVIEIASICPESALALQYSAVDALVQNHSILFPTWSNLTAFVTNLKENSDCALYKVFSNSLEKCMQEYMMGVHPSYSGPFSFSRIQQEDATTMQDSVSFFRNAIRDCSLPLTQTSSPSNNFVHLTMVFMCWLYQLASLPTVSPVANLSEACTSAIFQLAKEVYRSALPQVSQACSQSASETQLADFMESPLGKLLLWCNATIQMIPPSSRDMDEALQIVTYSIRMSVALDNCSAASELGCSDIKRESVDRLREDISAMAACKQMLTDRQDCPPGLQRLKSTEDMEKILQAKELTPEAMTVCDSLFDTYAQEIPLHYLSAKQKEVFLASAKENPHVSLPRMLSHDIFLQLSTALAKNLDLSSGHAIGGRVVTTMEEDRIQRAGDVVRQERLERERLARVAFDKYAHGVLLSEKGHCCLDEGCIDSSLGDSGLSLQLGDLYMDSDHMCRGGFRLFFLSRAVESSTDLLSQLQHFQFRHFPTDTVVGGKVSKSSAVSSLEDGLNYTLSSLAASIFEHPSVSADLDLITKGKKAKKKTQEVNKPSAASPDRSSDSSSANASVSGAARGVESTPMSPEHVVSKAVPRILLAAEEWSSSADSLANDTFLRRFVSQSLLSRSSAASTLTESSSSPSSTSRFDWGDYCGKVLEVTTDASVVLNLLLSRCLDELGSLRHVPSSVQGPLREAERKFFAVCVRFNQTTSECHAFAKSLAALNLIKSAAKKGVRCIFHRDLPQWFRLIANGTFRHIRSPIITLTRDAISEKEQLTESNSTATSSSTKLIVEKGEDEKEVEAKEVDESKEETNTTPHAAQPPLAVAASTAESHIAQWIENATFLLSDFTSEESLVSPPPDTLLSFSPRMSEEKESTDSSLADIPTSQLAKMNSVDPSMLSSRRQSKRDSSMGEPDSNRSNLDDEEDDTDGEDDLLQFSGRTLSTPIKTFVRSYSNGDDGANGTDHQPKSKKTSLQPSLFGSTSTYVPSSSFVSTNGKCSSPSAVASQSHGFGPSQSNAVSTEWMADLVKASFTLRDHLHDAVGDVQRMSNTRVVFLQTLVSMMAGKNKDFIVDRVFPVLHKFLFHKQTRGQTSAHLLHEIHSTVRGVDATNVSLLFLQQVSQTIARHIETAVSTRDAMTRSLSWRRFKRAFRLLTLDFHPSDRETIVGSGVLGTLLRCISTLRAYLTPLMIIASESSNQNLLDKPFLVDVSDATTKLWRAFLYMSTFCLSSLGEDSESRRDQGQSSSPRDIPTSFGVEDNGVSPAKRSNSRRSGFTLSAAISGPLLNAVKSNIEVIQQVLGASSTSLRRASLFSLKSGRFLSMFSEFVFFTTDALELLRSVSQVTKYPVCSAEDLVFFAEILHESSAVIKPSSGNTSPLPRSPLPSDIQAGMVRLLASHVHLLKPAAFHKIPIPQYMSSSPSPSPSADIGASGFASYLFKLVGRVTTYMHLLNNIHRGGRVDADSDDAKIREEKDQADDQAEQQQGTFDDRQCDDSWGYVAFNPSYSERRAISSALVLIVRSMVTLPDWSKFILPLIQKGIASLPTLCRNFHDVFSERILVSSDPLESLLLNVATLEVIGGHDNVFHPGSKVLIRIPADDTRPTEKALPSHLETRHVDTPPPSLLSPSYSTNEHKKDGSDGDNDDRDDEDELCTYESMYRKLSGTFESPIVNKVNNPCMEHLHAYLSHVQPESDITLKGVARWAWKVVPIPSEASSDALACIANSFLCPRTPVEPSGASSTFGKTKKDYEHSLFVQLMHGIEGIVREVRPLEPTSPSCLFLKHVLKAMSNTVYTHATEWNEWLLYQSGRRAFAGDVESYLSLLMELSVEPLAEQFRPQDNLLYCQEWVFSSSLFELAQETPFSCDSTSALRDRLDVPSAATEGIPVQSAFDTVVVPAKVRSDVPPPDNTTAAKPVKAEALEKPNILIFLSLLTEMGFDNIMARLALARNNGDVEQASNAILGGQYFGQSIDEVTVDNEWRGLLDRLGVTSRVQAWHQHEQELANSNSAGGAVLGSNADVSLSNDNGVDSSGADDFFDDMVSAAVEAAVMDDEKQEESAEQKKRREEVERMIKLGRERLVRSKNIASLSAGLYMYDPVTFYNTSGYQVHLRPESSVEYMDVYITSDAAMQWNSHLHQASQGSDDEKAYKKGDKITVVDTVGKVCPTEVISERGDSILIHYIGWSAKWDEWIPLKSTRIISDVKVGGPSVDGPQRVQSKGVGRLDNGVMNFNRLDLAGRWGTLMKIDTETGHALVRVYDAVSGAHVYVWMKMSVLRTCSPTIADVETLASAGRQRYSQLVASCGSKQDALIASTCRKLCSALLLHKRTSALLLSSCDLRSLVDVIPDLRQSLRCQHSIYGESINRKVHLDAGQLYHPLLLDILSRALVSDGIGTASANEVNDISISAHNDDDVDDDDGADVYEGLGVGVAALMETRKKKYVLPTSVTTSSATTRASSSTAQLASLSPCVSGAAAAASEVVATGVDGSERDAPASSTASGSAHQPGSDEDVEVKRELLDEEEDDVAANESTSVPNQALQLTAHALTTPVARPIPAPKHSSGLAQLWSIVASAGQNLCQFPSSIVVESKLSTVDNTVSASALAPDSASASPSNQAVDAARSESDSISSDVVPPSVPSGAAAQQQSASAKSVSKPSPKVVTDELGAVYEMGPHSLLKVEIKSDTDIPWLTISFLRKSKSSWGIKFYSDDEQTALLHTIRKVDFQNRQEPLDSDTFLVSNPVYILTSAKVLKEEQEQERVSFSVAPFSNARFEQWNSVTQLSLCVANRCLKNMGIVPPAPFNADDRNFVSPDRRGNSSAAVGVHSNPPVTVRAVDVTSPNAMAAPLQDLAIDQPIVDTPSATWDASNAISASKKKHPQQTNLDEDKEWAAESKSADTNSPEVKGGDSPKLNLSSTAPVMVKNEPLLHGAKHYAGADSAVALHTPSTADLHTVVHLLVYIMNTNAKFLSELEVYVPLASNMRYKTVELCGQVLAQLCVATALCEAGAPPPRVTFEVYGLYGGWLSPLIHEAGARLQVESESGNHMLSHYLACMVETIVVAMRYSFLVGFTDVLPLVSEVLPIAWAVEKRTRSALPEKLRVRLTESKFNSDHYQPKENDWWTESANKIAPLCILRQRNGLLAPMESLLLNADYWDDTTLKHPLSQSVLLQRSLLFTPQHEKIESLSRRLSTSGREVGIENPISSSTIPTSVTDNELSASAIDVVVSTPLDVGPNGLPLSPLTLLFERLEWNQTFRLKTFDHLLDLSASQDHNLVDVLIGRAAPSSKADSSDNNDDDDEESEDAEDAEVDVFDDDSNRVVRDSQGRVVKSPSELFSNTVIGQLCSSLQSMNVDNLRSNVSEIPWRTVFTSAQDRGGEGLPGPFRQALWEASKDIMHVASGSDDIESGPQGRYSLFIPCPNSQNETGESRNSLIIDPSRIDDVDLDRYFAFGRLLGVAIRSKCCLELDLAMCFWKQLASHEVLTEMDLRDFDYTTWSSLQFRNPATNELFTREEFDEYCEHVTYTTTLSDGKTTALLRSHGANERVLFEDRWKYAQSVLKARLNESAIQMVQIRRGLQSVVPGEALYLLTPADLKLRVCGQRHIDIELLKKFTVYSPPSKINEKTPVIVRFWNVLHSFTEAERALFLQFVWARSRLPLDMTNSSSDLNYRMQISVLESETTSLPRSETCFFNLKLPNYQNEDILREKLLQAIQNCVSITF